MTFMPWPSIEQFHHIKKFIRIDPGEWWKQQELLAGTSTVTYRAKVKLHGTNAAVQIPLEGPPVFQSRENIITPEKDNAGFARWGTEVFKDRHLNMILYGEWIGPGIQKGVAVNNIPKKCFAVFAARYLENSYTPDALIVEPEQLQNLIGDMPDVYVLPWYTRPAMHGSDTHVANLLSIDWKKSDEEIAALIAPVNDWVAAIEENDPWVEQTFGVKGTGEGLVFYPYSEPHRGYQMFTNLCFKAKGEKHKNVATAKPVQVNAEAAASIDAFVSMVLTPARLEQGARAILGEHKHQDSFACVFCLTGELTFDVKNTGKFVNWILKDIEKECQDELAASNLTFKDVQKSLSDKARTWFLNESKR